MFRCSSNAYSIQFHFLHDNLEPVVQIFPGSVDGSELLTFISTHLQLTETKYFGLRFQDSFGQIQWVKESKSIQKQFSSMRMIDVFFLVKYYVEHPDRLTHESTRYHFFMQLKRDIFLGRVTVDFSTAAKLLAYCLQAELGDFIADSEFFFHNYSSQFRFVAQQSYQLESMAEEIHKTLTSLSSADAERSFLRIAKDLDFYGLDIHSLYGDSDVEYQLGLSATGLLLFCSQSLLTKYSWSRIDKVERVKKCVSISVLARHGKSDVHSFRGSSKSTAKFFHHCCRDYHDFFQVKNNRGSSASSQGANIEAVKPSKTDASFTRTSLRRYSRRKLSTDLKLNQFRPVSVVSKQSKASQSEACVSRNTSSAHLRTGNDFNSGSFNRRAHRMNRIRRHYTGRTTASDTEAQVAPLDRGSSPGTSSRSNVRSRMCVSDDECPNDASSKLQRKFEWPIPESREPKIQSAVRRKSSYSFSEGRNSKNGKGSSEKYAVAMKSDFSSGVVLKSLKPSPKSGSYSVNSKSTKPKQLENLQTYNEYVQSKMSPKSTDTSSIRFSETPQANLSTILPKGSPFVRYATLRTFANPSKKSDARIKQIVSSGNVVLYSVDSGIGRSCDAVVSNSQEIGVVNPAYCNTTQSGPDIYAHCDSPQLLSSTPNTPRTRSVRSLNADSVNEPEPVLLDVNATPIRNHEDSLLDMNEVSNANLLYSVNSSGFERSTFTVNL